MIWTKAIPNGSGLLSKWEMISCGRNRVSISSVASGVISLINELETCEYSSSAIKNTVSMSGSSCLFAIIMLNSAAMSVSGRTPRTIVRAPHWRTNSTASPWKVRISTLRIGVHTRRTKCTRSSAVKSGFFLVLMPTPTISCSNRRAPR